MTLNIRLAGFPELREATIRLPEKIRQTAIEQMSEIAYDGVQAGAGRHAKHSPSPLFESVFNRPTERGGREVGHDLGRAPYAPFVIFGTRPHTIRPREKKALRWASGGEFVFAKWVNHPGYAGDDYLTTSMRAALDQLGRIISDITVFE